MALLLAGGAVWYVLAPVLQPSLAPEASAAGDAGDDPDDDFSSRAVALRALKEIEFDKATGKLADVDYEHLRTKYTAEALAAMRRDEGGGTRDASRSTPTPPASPGARPVCPVDGPRPEGDADFCSVCGRRLELAAGYCTRCGGALEADARFCGRCGVSVAA